MALEAQPRPDSGLGFQVEVLTMFEGSGSYGRWFMVYDLQFMV